MSRMFLGLKSGVPVLKVMADSGDDPLTTPNSAYEKFRFNSENTEYSYADDIIFWPKDTTTYYPPGRTAANYVIKAEGNRIYCNAARAIAYYGFLPLILHRYLDAGEAYYFRADSGGLGGNPLSMAKVKKNSSSSGSIAYDSIVGHPDELVSMTGGLDFDLLSIVTRFPCDRDYNALAGVPIPGQCFASFDEKRGYARVGRAGVDVKTASAIQCLIHEDQRPISICAHGFATVTAGATVTVPIDVDVPDGAFPYFQGAGVVGGNMVSLSWPFPSLLSLGYLMEGHVSGNDLVITNGNSITQTIYWVVMVEDQQAPTSGGSGKILTTSDDKVLVMRPGASSTPVPADILLSSDYRYCPLVDYGAIPDSSFTTPVSGAGDKEFTISFPSIGNNPIILTAIQKIGAGGIFNDGDVLIDAYWLLAVGSAPNTLSYWWEWDASTSSVNFRVLAYGNTGWVLRYYILAVPD